MLVPRPAAIKARPMTTVSVGPKMSDVQTTHVAQREAITANKKDVASDMAPPAQPAPRKAAMLLNLRSTSRLDSIVALSDQAKYPAAPKTPMTITKNGTIQ